MVATGSSPEPTRSPEQDSTFQEHDEVAVASSSATVVGHVEKKQHPLLSREEKIKAAVGEQRQRQRLIEPASSDSINKNTTTRILTDEQDAVHMHESQDKGFESRLGLCAVGIILTLGTYGYLQEKIMTVPYDVETTPECQIDEKQCLFQHSIFLVIVNRFFPCIVAFITMYYQGTSLAPAAPIWKFFLISFSNVFSTASRYEALRYLDFPTQLLGKSAKMVPVMVWSHFVGGKSFSLRSWLIAAGVTGGWVAYFLSGAKAKDDMSSAAIVFFGAFWMFAYLASDGYTSMFQEKLFSGNKNMSKYNQMAWVNATSGIVSLFGVMWSGNLGDALQFCVKHPWFVWDTIVLSASATVAQYVIYTTIKEYGAMALAACMNVRQVLSTLLSFYMYSHKISIDQVLSLVVVFGSLFMKQQNSKRKTD